MVIVIMFFMMSSLWSLLPYDYYITMELVKVQIVEICGVSRQIERETLHVSHLQQGIQYISDYLIQQVTVPLYGHHARCAYADY